MAGEDLVETTKGAYEAFSRGDIDAAIAIWADDAEWRIPGNSAISGTYNGKQEILGLWGKFGEAGPQLTVNGVVSDGERVIAFTTTKVGDEEWETADISTFRDGKAVSFDSVEDTDALERAFPG